MNNKISVCIIAKNEEENIEKCLLSVQDIADEIIVLDTGSIDKTCEIASKYAKVYHYNWQNDFSKARNVCLSYAKAEWIMFIDADEVLDKQTANSLDKFLDSYSLDKPIVFNFRIVNHIKEKILPEVYRNTLFTNHFGIKFSKPVGEYLDIEKGTFTLEKYPEFLIIHNKLEKEDVTNKAIKYIDIIDKIVKSNISIHEKCSYYVETGDYYGIIGNNSQAFNYYLKAYNMAETIKDNVNKSFFENVLTRIINNLLKTNNFKEILIYINKLRAIDNNFYTVPEFIKSQSNLIDAFCFGAYASKLFYDKEYTNAIPLYEYLINFFSNNLNNLEIKIYFYNMLTDLAKLYVITKQDEKSINTLIYLFKIKNNSREILIQILKYYYERGQIDKIIFFLQQSTNNSPDIIELVKELKQNIDENILINKVDTIIKTSTWLEV